MAQQVLSSLSRQRIGLALLKLVPVPKTEKESERTFRHNIKDDRKTAYCAEGYPENWV